MANIWAVYEGKEPTIGGPWARLPVSEAVEIFELRPSDHISDLTSTPRFGDVDRDLVYAGYKHIVVEVEQHERQAKWRPGFYKSKVKPKEAFDKLIRQALVAELGKKNVVRVTSEPTTDSQGRGALKVTVVIPPDAVHKLKGGPVLDALVNLQQRLHEMREDRVPIIEYATEEELELDAGSRS